MNHRTSRAFGRSVLSAALAVSLSASPVRAEESKADLAQGSTLEPGQRLRVTAASPTLTGVTVGNLVRLAADRLTLVDAEHGAVTELPLSSVTRIEVGRERRQTQKWLLIGIGIGAAGGVAIATDNSPSCGGYGEPFRACTSSEKIGLAVGIAAVWGGLGAWFGHSRKITEWSNVPVDRFKVSLRPERGGGRIGLAFSF
jgi:hypothetical protein